MERPWCHSGEKHEPAGDIDTVSVDGLKALDPNRPIREADIGCVFDLSRAYTGAVITYARTALRKVFAAFPADTGVA